MGWTVPELKQKLGEEVWYVRYQCQYRRHSRLISADTANHKVAAKTLAEFIELFDAGLVDQDFSFIRRKRERLQQESREYQERLAAQTKHLIAQVLPQFEKVHLAGEIRRRGDRKETQTSSTRAVMGQLRRVLDGLTRIDEITPEHVIRWGETFVAGGRRSKTTRRHHETSVKSFTS